MDVHQKIAVAIVGGGAIAPLHAKHILTSPTCKLVAIIDPFPSGQALAEKLSVSHFKTIADLLQSSDIQPPQIYYITTPSGLHVKLATEVLELAYGTAKVILVEKPISTDSFSGEGLLSLAASKGITIAAGHHRRLNPSIRAAKSAILADKAGSITAISGSWALKKNDSYFNTEWRVSRSAGGGPIWTNFVHDIDLLHYLVNSYVTRIWVVSTASRRNKELSSGNDGVEEGAAMMMIFANGVVGTFIISDNVVSPYAWEPASGDSPLYPQAPGSAIDCFRIFGSRGTLTVPDLQLWSYRQAEEDKTGGKMEGEVGWNMPMTREVLAVEESIPFQLQVESLARVVKGESGPVCSGEEGLMAVKVCEAVIQALDRGDGLPVDIRLRPIAR